MLLGKNLLLSCYNFFTKKEEAVERYISLEIRELPDPISNIITKSSFYHHSLPSFYDLMVMMLQDLQDQEFWYIGI